MWCQLVAVLCGFGALADFGAVQGNAKKALLQCACFMVVLFPWKSGWMVCICVKYAGGVVGDVCFFGLLTLLAIGVVDAS